MAVKRSLEELEDKDSVLVSKKTRNKNSESGNSSDSMTSTSSASDDLEALDESQDSDDADEDESTSSDSTATGLGEESSADDGKLSIPQVPLPTKHLISSSPSSNLRSRVSSFLPVLQAANAKLDEDRATGKLEERLIDDADGDGQYIEMNLGLGVLEETGGTSSDEDTDRTGDDEDQGTHGDADQAKKDVMGKLMGKKQQKPTIQEVT